jgi:hypothetical protein
MIPYHQETDSRTPYSHSFAIRARDQTVASWIDSCAFPLSKSSALTELARNAICEIKDAEARNQAKRLLSTIQKTFTALEQAGAELSHLPTLRATLLEGATSVLIEWLLPDFRVGFSIEPKANDSSWYLVSSKRLEEISGSGQLLSANFEDIVLQLINFTVTNS